MKYKYNGQWYDVAVKALDSMPVGTQIEYTGTTIPTGWEQANDYSTTEMDTGQLWLDGKKIYKKTFDTTITYTYSENGFMYSWISMGLGSSGVDTLVNMYGSIIDSNNTKYFVNTTNMCNVIVTSNNRLQIGYKLESPYPTNHKLKVTVEYTKTS